MDKTIGILGGMGPLATADLFRKIVLLTKADSDNEHIRIYIDNNAQIPDRTAAILRGGTDPVPFMADAAKHLEMCGASVIIMPCNTAHYFYDRVRATVNVPFLHMIEETGKAIALHPEITTVGLLATDGTIQSGLYANILKKYGKTVIAPEGEDQKAVMEAIYDGVKAGKALSPDAFMRTIRHLKEKGAQSFVLGCTEIPIVFDMFDINEPFFDPTTLLAKAAIRFVGKEVRE